MPDSSTGSDLPREARLIYRDAAVSVLDEPTAALDAESEAAIFAELFELQAAGNR